MNSKEIRKNIIRVRAAYVQAVYYDTQNRNEIHQIHSISIYTGSRLWNEEARCFQASDSYNERRNKIIEHLYTLWLKKRANFGGL